MSTSNPAVPDGGKSSTSAPPPTSPTHPPTREEDKEVTVSLQDMSLEAQEARGCVTNEGAEVVSTSIPVAGKRRLSGGRSTSPSRGMPSESKRRPVDVAPSTSEDDTDRITSNVSRVAEVTEVSDTSRASNTADAPSSGSGATTCSSSSSGAVAPSSTNASVVDTVRVSYEAPIMSTSPRPSQHHAGRRRAHSPDSAERIRARGRNAPTGTQTRTRTTSQYTHRRHATGSNSRSSPSSDESEDAGIRRHQHRRQRVLGPSEERERGGFDSYTYTHEAEGVYARDEGGAGQAYVSHSHTSFSPMLRPGVSGSRAGIPSAVIAIDSGRGSNGTPSGAAHRSTTGSEREITEVYNSRLSGSSLNHRSRDAHLDPAWSARATLPRGGDNHSLEYSEFATHSQSEGRTGRGARSEPSLPQTRNVSQQTRAAENTHSLEAVALVTTPSVHPTGSIRIPPFTITHLMSAAMEPEVATATASALYSYYYESAMKEAKAKLTALGIATEYDAFSELQAQLLRGSIPPSRALPHSGITSATGTGHITTGINFGSGIGSYQHLATCAAVTATHEPHSDSTVLAPAFKHAACLTSDHSTGATATPVSAHSTLVSITGTTMVSGEAVVLAPSRFLLLSNLPPMACFEPMHIFNLMSIYGTVCRVAVSKDALQGLVEFDSPADAATASAQLSGLTLRGGPVHCTVVASEQAALSLSASEAMKSFVGSSLQRTTTSGSGVPLVSTASASGSASLSNGKGKGNDVKHACPPSPVLHIANLPDPPKADVAAGGLRGGSDEAVVRERLRFHQVALAEKLTEMLSGFSPVAAVQFPKSSSRMAYVAMDSKEHACEALMKLHNTSIHGRTLRISFASGGNMATKSS